LRLRGDRIIACAVYAGCSDYCCVCATVLQPLPSLRMREQVSGGARAAP
jgi:hypothetical protein